MESKRSLPEALGHCAHVPGLGHNEAFYKWNENKTVIAHKKRQKWGCFASNEACLVLHSKFYALPLSLSFSVRRLISFGISGTLFYAIQ